MRTLTTLALAFLLQACATLPDDAPAELKTAEQALDLARTGPASKALPTTVERAEQSYDQAVALLRSGERDQAIAKANEAGNLASEANILGRKIAGWDGRIEQYFEEQLATQALFDMMAGNVPVNEAAESVCVDPSGVGLMTRVAFFAPGTDELSERDMPSITSLAEFLEAMPALKVRLVGHSDARGKDTANDKLARRRAEVVAEALQNAGVSPARIEIVSEGEGEAADEGAPKTEQALDRNVAAFVLGSDDSQVTEMVTPGTEDEEVAH